MPRTVRVLSFAVAAAFAMLPLSEIEGRQNPGRALTIEDYYRIRTVGAAALSPNGHWVSYTVSTRIEADNGTKTETWLAAADACRRRAVSCTKAKMSPPRDG